MGELWGISAEFFQEKTPQEIRSALYFALNIAKAISNESEFDLTIAILYPALMSKLWVGIF